MWNVVWTMLTPIVESCQQETKTSVDASQNVTGGVNVTALVSPAQHCVDADARLRHHETPCV